MESNRNLRLALVFNLFLSSALFGQAPAPGTAGESVHTRTIGISVNSQDGSYTIFDPLSKTAILHSGVAAEVDHQWLRSSEYPHHFVTREQVGSDSGSATKLTISNTGLTAKPDLTCSIEIHPDPDFVTLTVLIRNSGSNPVTVQALRSIDARGSDIADLGGPSAADRILSDSFSEDRPGITIHDLGDTPNQVHRAIGSQLMYNRQSKRNLFIGALTSNRFLTYLRLRVSNDQITSYDVDSAGTTEIEKENSLKTSPPEDQVELSLPLAPAGILSSETLLISTGEDYHRQLETYGRTIRELHHARVNAPSKSGWWSWTAYYFGLNEGAALTNAGWLAAHLKDLGYDVFHIDEGYQYARGEYTVPDAGLFPSGMGALEGKIRSLGLTPAIWTAPFEVSERSWVFQHHKDWLVHNAAGQPIHAGWVIRQEPRLDALYILDCTHPEAQAYLRQTYTTLTRDWGIRVIKMDFMDDSAIEGYYHKPNTTALEAQRTGLQIIRDTVGDDVLLDKDGSPMLNPVGIVDLGRISVDTGHTFVASKEAAPGIAARYYMNRNFYVTDPDAFTVSRQTVEEHEWHGGKHPLTLDEAKVSIALAAVSGGMYEIGDDLPRLDADPERLLLIENEDLRNMARLGRASLPLDLMSYSPQDEMPSIFLLKESKRQSILTVFNWTENKTEHNLDLVRDLGLELQGHNQVIDLFNPTAGAENNLETIRFTQDPHSVKQWKILDRSIAPAAPTVRMEAQDHVEAGAAASFSAQSDPAGVPVLEYRWDFGDGTTGVGATITHTYTHAGDYSVHFTAEGLAHIPFSTSYPIRVTGRIDMRFEPSRKKRLVETH